MGFDTNIFLSPVHKELICSICFGVFEKPVYLPLCRHVFCAECISNWLNQSNQVGNRTCPIDKKPIKINKEELMKKKISYNLSNIISDSLVMCKYRHNGCDKTFSLSAFGDHCKSCPHKDESTEPLVIAANNGDSSATAQATTGNGNPSGNLSTESSKTEVATNSKQSTSTTTTQGKAKSKKHTNLCKLMHPNKLNAKTYFHQNWPHGEKEKLAKLMFKNIVSSFLPYNIAGYIKNLLSVDVYCIHTECEYQNLTKDLNVYVLEKDADKVLRHEKWPLKVHIRCVFDHKEITIKGSLKTLRMENFYGFNERNPERKLRKEINKKIRIEKVEEKKKSKEINKARNEKSADKKGSKRKSRQKAANKSNDQANKSNEQANKSKKQANKSNEQSDKQVAVESSSESKDP